MEECTFSKVAGQAWEAITQEKPLDLPFSASPQRPRYIM